MDCFVASLLVMTILNSNSYPGTSCAANAICATDAHARAPPAYLGTTPVRAAPVTAAAWKR
jgi:hypothetical protein